MQHLQRITQGGWIVNEKTELKLANPLQYVETGSESRVVNLHVKESVNVLLGSFRETKPKKRRKQSLL